MKLILFTGIGYRHKYLAAQLAMHFDLLQVIAEGPSEDTEGTPSYSEEDLAFAAEHIQQESDAEMEFFGDFEEFPQEVPLRELPFGEINSQEISDLVEHSAPDYIILFGTSVLESSLMDSYKNRIINLHLGLTPYYTGSYTHLFPYFYDEPEGIGASIHLVTTHEEAGEILHQLRPDISPEDRLHGIGNKLVWKAGKQLPGVLKGFAGGHITPQPQMPAGRICLEQDLTPQVLREIYGKFGQGLIREYLDGKVRRDAAQPIVDADLQLE